MIKKYFLYYSSFAAALLCADSTCKRTISTTEPFDAFASKGFVHIGSSYPATPVTDYIEPKTKTGVSILLLSMPSPPQSHTDKNRAINACNLANRDLNGCVFVPENYTSFKLLSVYV